MIALRLFSKQAWIVPEVVQSSAMDCGPASLKCALEGLGKQVSYGRLREACQTDVDGTSIDMIEEVANQLGIDAQQVMLPLDHVFLSESHALPAIFVVKRSDGATHFVVVWRRHGEWLQVMDPAVGRRWVKCKQFAQELYHHQLSVIAENWRTWVATDDFLNPFYQRLALLGVQNELAKQLAQTALQQSRWFAMAALDAATRLVSSLVDADGLSKGEQAHQLIQTLFERTMQEEADIYRYIPTLYWSVGPDTSNQDASQEKLLLKGVVLLKVSARKDTSSGEAQQTLSPELQAALSEKSTNSLSTMWDMLKSDGLLAPLALVGAMGIAVGVVMIQMLLFKGIFDIAWALNLPSQRLIAVIALVAFLGLLLLVEVPIAMESMRMGRHLETRLRMALLAKLPQLSDRYFQSRPVSDMAERSHSIYLSRLVPGLGIHFIQALSGLVFTLIGIAIIDTSSAILGVAIVLVAIVFNLLMQPLLNERDLRMRSHIGALNGYYLDALLGAVPIRTHRAEKAVSLQHEALLVEWVRAGRSMIGVSLLASGSQALLCLSAAIYLIYDHFMREGAVSGGDLLLVYWTMRLPAITHELSALAQQYPAQRNVLLRLLEPLAAPNATNAQNPAAASASAQPNHAANIRIDDGKVLAAGHSILQNIQLQIAAGEHVAIVGASGAGKSSLIGLLLGWHRLSQGQLLVDDTPLQGEKLDHLRRQTAWVDPAIQLWNTSFLNNLSYSVDEVDMNRASLVLEAANLRGILQKLPQGLQSYLGEGGGLLSGGEGQRVRLGRALMQNDVRLALLDEPFRGIDREQRMQLLAEVRDWWRDATLLCITHDVSETMAFNRVLVIEDGRIVEDGSPSKLAFGDTRYRHLLQTEAMVRNEMWKGQQWRHLRIENGEIAELDETQHTNSTWMTANGH